MNESLALSIDQLLSVWQAAFAAGRDIPARVLCRERPELLGDVERKIAAIRHIQRLSPPLAPPDNLVTLSIGDTAVPDQPASPRPVAPAGRMIDCYRLVRLLGEGGMGEVWEAEDTKLHRSVAVKMMLPGLLASDKARERFLREARSQASVHHDHVAVIHAVGEADGALFIVMPLLRGETLATRLARAPGVEFGEQLRIGREIAEGLAAAHERGLIHRDVKPANIWLEGDTAKVRLLDFGLARIANRESDGSITASGVVIGTPAYMAPEQAAADNVDSRADLFSLGVVLYEMSTGRRPFAGKSTFSILNALATFEPPAPIALRGEIPPDLSDVIQSLLIKDPALRRPQSAPEAVEVLRSIEAGRAPPRSMVRGRPAPVSRGFVWRSAAAVAAVLLLALALAYQVKSLTFPGTDAVVESTKVAPPATKPDAPDPYKAAAEKLEALLPRLRKQPLAMEFTDESGHGVAGLKRKNLHHFKGTSGIPLLKQMENGVFLLKLDYEGDYNRESYDLGIISARESDAIRGRMEFEIQSKDGQITIKTYDQFSENPKTTPTDQNSHQTAKKAVLLLIKEVLPGAL